jgi:hypothetical protein
MDKQYLSTREEYVFLQSVSREIRSNFHVVKGILKE